jgi:phosphoserine phosphatase
MKYKLVIFDMDGTLLHGRTIFALADAQGFTDQLLKVIKSDWEPYKKTLEIAKMLKCTTIEKFFKTFRKIPLHENAKEVVHALKSAGCKIAIATDSYHIAALDVKKRLVIDYAFANEIVIKNNHLTGNVELHNTDLFKRHGHCRVHSICKRDILIHLCEELGITKEEVIAVGDGTVDICMLREAGLGIAFNAPVKVRQSADVSINNLNEILKYAEGV